MRRVLPVLALLLAAPAVAGEKAAPRQITHDRMEGLSSEIGAYQARTGRLPSGAEGVESLARDPSLLVDGWGRPILYVRVPGGYALISLGADGKPGGEGEAADIVHLVR